MKTQTILTPACNEVLQILLDLSRDDKRIVSVAPYFLAGMFSASGYIVIAEDAEDWS